MTAPTTAPRASLSMPVVAAVAAGGAVGACARVAVGELAPTDADGFPWSTLAINVLGCALLAFLPRLEGVRRHHLLPPMLGTGVLGGFTTLSTWSAETNALLEADRLGLATVYAVVTLVACLSVVALVDRVTTLAQRTVFDSEEGDL